VVPLRGMESGAAEFVHAVDVGRPRDVQRAGAGDQKLSDVLVPRFGKDVPAVFAVIPVRTAYLLTESDVAAQPVLFGDVLEVVQDLWLRGEQLAPGGLRLE
jgi:hypothetical protein